MQMNNVLIVSNELQEAREMVGSKIPDSQKGTRSEVPKYLNIMDFLCGLSTNLFKVATSPTKEAMGYGIPIFKYKDRRS